MKIIWTNPAIDDLESIRDHIAHDSKFYAQRFIEKIILAVEHLENFPKMGRKVPEADQENFRELIFQNYRIMYRYTENSLYIVTIVHCARELGNFEIKPWEIC